MDIDYQADVLAQKIKHLMIITNGRTTKHASSEEFYQAFCLTLREEMMINWTASLDTMESTKARVLYFLSMEYLPGRYLRHNIINMGASELIRAVLKKMERNFEDLVSCEPDAGLGNGGLGRLSSCFLDSLVTQHYPARGYGLRYQYGIFEQEVWEGRQVERPDCWLLNANPWESRRDTLSTNVLFGGCATASFNQEGEEVCVLEDFEEVRALPYDSPIIGYSENANYSVLTLRLWSTKESPRNFQLQRYNAGFLDSAAENTSLTDVLYPNDNTELGKRVRLKQEFLLVSASIQDIIRRHLRVHGDISLLADKTRIQINDTHPALVIAELVHTLTNNYNFSWQKAWETCQECCSYTNHTILKEGLEEWNEKRMWNLLPRQFRIIQHLNLQLCNQAREKFPGDEEKVRRLSILEHGQIKMSHLAIFGSHKVNGVAALHTEILKTKLFSDFYDLSPEKFINVTNGVTQRRWLLDCNPLLAAFISQRIGREWICDFTQLHKLASFASDKQSQEAFLQIKRQNKTKLLQFLGSAIGIRNAQGKMTAPYFFPDENALFDLHIKRIHEYKRQLMNVLHLIMVYHEIIDHGKPSCHRFAIFGGKAAPGYERAKQIIRLICALSRKFRDDPEVRKHLTVIFVENYNVSRAEVLIPAADLSEQISTAGQEASGTGNMKLAMNGALTIGTEDGANIEMRQAVTDLWWPFRFGATAAENEKPYLAWDVYMEDAQIRRAMDALKDGTFAENEEESSLFMQIYHDLLQQDNYRVLQDLRGYYETQKKAAHLFVQPAVWAETAIHNIAGMGQFSVDIAIRKYAEEIWHLTPCFPDSSILNKVRTEYAEHDRCKISRSK